MPGLRDSLEMSAKPEGKAPRAFIDQKTDIRDPVYRSVPTNAEGSSVRGQPWSKSSLSPKACSEPLLSLHNLTVIVSLVSSGLRARRVNCEVSPNLLGQFSVSLYLGSFM